MSTYKKQRIGLRSGYQTTGHKTYCIGVPWQIAEAIPKNQEFMPSVDELSGVITFTAVNEPDMLVPYGRIMAALAVMQMDPALQRQLRLLLDRMAGLPYEYSPPSEVAERRRQLASLPDGVPF